MKKPLLVLLSILILPMSLFGQSEVYEVSKGDIHFHSNAPQELIKAASAYLSGIVDVKNRTFFFKISIASFIGFNSPLQKEHFNENYLESDVFPFATFSGKIIEEIDLSKNGAYDIRAKGKMTIHGVEEQRLICLQSDFTVLLADHNIKIPRIVSDKLSPEINVSVNAVLIKKT